MNTESGGQLPVRRHPEWIRARMPGVGEFRYTQQILTDARLHTVCEEAQCPNRSECYAHRTATFMILGNVCTRPGGFCSVPRGKTEALEDDEPERVAEAAERLGLRHVVITSVTRDDLPDGGAGVFAETVRAVRREMEGADVEVLVPDFQGSRESLQIVLEAGPRVLAHNLETVRRLQPAVRPQASYDRSLSVLRFAADFQPRTAVKSGLMLGMGETAGELDEAMNDLVRAGCELLTLGQYMAPSSAHHPVARFVDPGEFDEYAGKARALGFRGVASAPRVRSSYKAAELLGGVGG